MDMSPEVLQAKVNLAESMAHNSGTLIWNRIRAARDSGHHDEVVADSE
jgi:hypothetical protein